MGHLNGILARVGGNLNNNFQKSQMPGELPKAGMLKLRFDRYISVPCLYSFHCVIATEFELQPVQSTACLIV